MDVVIGGGGLAEALAENLGTEGRALLVGPPAEEGRFLWRRGDPDSGEGLRSALIGARRVFLVVANGSAAHGALAMLERATVGSVVVAVGAGQPVPAGLERHAEWARVEVGPAWGAREPLVARWSRLIATGRHVWIADPGPVHAVAMADAVAAVVAAADAPGVRWRVTTERATRLPALVEALGHYHDRPVRSTRVPLGLATRQVGLPRAHVRAWLEAPGAPPETPGWTPPEPAGTRGWVAGLPRAPR